MKCVAVGYTVTQFRSEKLGGVREMIIVAVTERPEVHSAPRYFGCVMLAFEVRLVENPLLSIASQAI